MCRSQYLICLFFEGHYEENEKASCRLGESISNTYVRKRTGI